MSYSAEVLADSPVAWYRMAEASGLIQDSSGNGNHATSAVGTAAYSQTGLIDTDPSDDAIDFTGDDAFVVPDHATLDLGDVYTLEAWINLDSVSGYQTITSKGSGAAQFGTDNTTIFLARQDVAFIAHSTGITLATATTYHVVVTKNGSDVHIYVDGVDVTDTVTNSTCVSTSVDLTIGGKSGGGGQHIDGRMDEVAVYGTALSAGRVLAHYEAATIAAGSSAVGWWGRDLMAEGWWGDELRPEGWYGEELMAAASAGAVTYPQALTATVTTTAAMSKVVNKIMSAIVTTTATIQKLTSKFMTATVTTSATIRKVMSKALTATVTTTATIAKVKAITLSATVTITATISKIKAITLSATVTTTATIRKQISKSLTATVTTTASIRKVMSKALTATVTTTATISKLISKRLTATVTTTASIGRSVVTPITPLLMTATVMVSATINRLYLAKAFAERTRRKFVRPRR